MNALVIVCIEENVTLHVSTLTPTTTFFDLTVSKHAPSKTTTTWCFGAFSCWPVCETVEDILLRTVSIWDCRLAELRQFGDGASVMDEVSVVCAMTFK